MDFSFLRMQPMWFKSSWTETRPKGSVRRVMLTKFCNTNSSKGSTSRRSLRENSKVHTSHQRMIFKILVSTKILRRFLWNKKKKYLQKSSSWLINNKKNLSLSGEWSTWIRSRRRKNRRNLKKKVQKSRRNYKKEGLNLELPMSPKLSPKLKIKKWKD